MEINTLIYDNDTIILHIQTICVCVISILAEILSFKKRQKSYVIDTHPLSKLKLHAMRKNMLMTDEDTKWHQVFL